MLFVYNKNVNPKNSQFQVTKNNLSSAYASLSNSKNDNHIENLAKGYS